VPDWAADAAELGYPRVFVTVSGAHLYGFASVDSDLDLRGAHLLPLAEVVGLRTGPQTLQRTGDRDGVELDVVSHDLAKFCTMLLRRNGYVLEQLLSPLVVATSPLHAELVALAPACLTRHHAHHYLGFAAGQWRLFERTRRLKPALYTLRTLLTGAHLMRTGEVVADLRLLYAGSGLPYVPELIAAKTTAERVELDEAVVSSDRVTADVVRLRGALATARDASRLPETPTAAAALHDLLVRARLGAG
jgi:hypothetical protein